MNKKTKKIIAREFLFFLTLLIISGLFLIAVFPYNSYKERKVDNYGLKINDLNSEIEKISGKAYKKLKQQNWYHSKISDEFNVNKPPYNRIEKLWKQLQNLAIQDSLKLKWSDQWSEKVKNFHQNLGFNNGDEFQSFVLLNSLTQSDSTSLSKSELKRAELLKLEKLRDMNERDIMNENNVMNLLSILITILFIVMFILRYLIYAVKWSLKTLKTE